MLCTGFVEARIRKLPEFLEGQRGQRLPIKHPIHLYPVKFPTQKSPNSICYFIGFDMDAKLVAKTDKNVYLSERVEQFVFSLNDPTYGYKGSSSQIHFVSHSLSLILFYIVPTLPYLQAQKKRG